MAAIRCPAMHGLSGKKHLLVVFLKTTTAHAMPHTKVAWLNVGLGTHTGTTRSPWELAHPSWGAAEPSHWRHFKTPALKNPPGQGMIAIYVNGGLKGISWPVSKMLFLPYSFSFC